MRKLFSTFSVFFILSMTFLVSCECDNTKKIYSFEVVYITGETDTLQFYSTGINKFSLNRGDLQHLRGVNGNHEILVSGVRQFRTISIKVVQDSLELSGVKAMNF